MRKIIEMAECWIFSVFYAMFLSALCIVIFSVIFISAPITSITAAKKILKNRKKDEENLKKIKDDYKKAKIEIIKAWQEKIHNLN